jgi:hypothetical protein
MSASQSPGLQDCNCLAIRQAARHVTQFYDQLFAPVGLRATQFAILNRLRRDGPMTINALAGALVLDRTTLGRNILPRAAPQRRRSGEAASGERTLEGRPEALRRGLRQRARRIAARPPLRGHRQRFCRRAIARQLGRADPPARRYHRGGGPRWRTVRRAGG